MGKQVGFKELADWDGHIYTIDTVYKVDAQHLLRGTKCTVQWRRPWQPTPVFLPGESQGRGSQEGCRLWGHTESDTTEAT